MFVEVSLGPRGSIELHDPDDVEKLVVRVWGYGGLIDLREAMAAADVGVPFGHEAAIDTRWIRAQGNPDDSAVWEELFGRLWTTASRRGQADPEGQWIVGPIVWQGDRLRSSRDLTT
jgi:hypothetical protein